MALEKGDHIPQFELQDQHGATFKSDALKDTPVVLYFYPKNFTPGCTREACDFRDQYEDFKKLGATVIGVSSDTVNSHARFAKKHDIPFIFLADEKGKLRKKFGVKSELFGLLPGRETFVFDKNGQLITRYNSLSASKHTRKALEALKKDTNDN